MIMAAPVSRPDRQRRTDRRFHNAGLLAGAAACPSWPIDRPASSVARPAFHPGTTPRSRLPMQVAHGLERASGFFKSSRSPPVLLGVPRPAPDMGEAELPENTSEADLGQINRKARTKDPLEIDAARGHKSVLLRIGTSLHEAAQFLHLLIRKLRRSAGRFGIDQAIGSALIKAVHPIPQRLAIHAADACNLLAIPAVVDRRQRQQPPRLMGIFYRCCQSAQHRRLVVLSNFDC